METWTEIEDTYLTDQPLIWDGRGKVRKQIPDPDRPPTEIWLCGYSCKRLKDGRIKRKRKIIPVKIVDDPDTAVMRVFSQPNVILIADQESPNEYAVSGDEPIAI